MPTKYSFYNIAKELEVAQENEGYLIVIRCGAFFTSIGANAIALSNELGLKLTCWKKGLCKAGVPINALYNYVKRLDSLGYNYVIYNYSKDEIINNGKKYAECYRFEGKPIDKSNLLLDCKDCEYYEKSYSNIDIFTDMKRIQEFKELKEKQEKIEKMGKIISLLMKTNKFHKSLRINYQTGTKDNMKLFIILSRNKNLKGGNKMSQSEELVLIPKYEKYMQYMIEAIVKMPRTEKFNIGNEFKAVMYKTLENILYINKVEISKRMYYLNLIDALLSTQRVMLRLMVKNRWIDEKKFRVSMEMLYEIGKILGGLIKQYAKNNKK